MSDRRALEVIVANWPDPPEKPTEEYSPVLRGEAQPIADSLIEAGLLILERPVVQSLATKTLDLDLLTAAVQDTSHSIPIRLGHIIGFLLSCISAQFALRFRSFYSVVQTVAERKAIYKQSTLDFDVQRAIELAGIFRRLRPFAFSGRGHCLYHALTLITFLARYRIFPNWVIAVAARPWAAHSWVQQETMLFDSMPDRVWDYTPILVV